MPKINNMSSDCNGGETAFFERLSEAKIAELVENERLKISVFDTVESTNSEAKRISADGVSEPVLIAAEAQSAGRGRMGRSFYSPFGTGLYMSYLYKPETALSDNVAVTSAAAVAVVRAIREVAGIECRIKWVNDIYFENRKICGILTEAVTDSKNDKHCVTVGIGINVSTEAFPDELKAKAGSLGKATIDRNRLAAATVNHLETLIKGLPERTFLEEYRSSSLVIGKHIVYTENGRETEAVAVGIDGNGALTVKNHDGTEAVLNTGEISLRIEQ